MFSINNHRLIQAGQGYSVSDFDSENYNHDRFITPKYVVVHYTACNRETAIKAFTNKNGDRVSAHLLIDSDGAVIQFVGLNRRAWHAGESYWNGLSDLNTHSIGIELVNYGYLQKTVSGKFTISSGQAFPFGPDEIIEARHSNPACPYRFWHAYPHAQIESCSLVLQALFSAYSTLVDVIGHDDIAPKRKLDPGPALPMQKLRSLALGRDFEENASTITYVTVPKLNIRVGPDISYPKTTASPLPINTKLVLLDRQAEWIKVRVDSSQGEVGWVLASYTSNGA